MKISNETKIGVLAVVCVALLIVGVRFLKGKGIFKKETQIYAVYSDVQRFNSIFYFIQNRVNDLHRFVKSAGAKGCQQGIAILQVSSRITKLDFHGRAAQQIGINYRQ